MWTKYFTPDFQKISFNENYLCLFTLNIRNLKIIRSRPRCFKNAWFLIINVPHKLTNYFYKTAKTSESILKLFSILYGHISIFERSAQIITKGEKDFVILCSHFLLQFDVLGTYNFVIICCVNILYKFNQISLDLMTKNLLRWKIIFWVKK